MLGVMLGSFWDRLGDILETCWGHFGIVLGSFGGQLGVILGSFADRFGDSLGSFWEHFGINLGLPGGMLGSIWLVFGVYGRYFGVYWLPKYPVVLNLLPIYSYPSGYMLVLERQCSFFQPHRCPFLQRRVRARGVDPLTTAPR